MHWINSVKIFKLLNKFMPQLPWYFTSLPLVLHFPSLGTSLPFPWYFTSLPLGPIISLYFNDLLACYFLIDGLRYNRRWYLFQALWDSLRSRRRAYTFSLKHVFHTLILLFTHVYGCGKGFLTCDSLHALKVKTWSTPHEMCDVTER